MWSWLGLGWAGLGAKWGGITVIGKAVVKGVVCMTLQIPFVASGCVVKWHEKRSESVRFGFISGCDGLFPLC